MGTVTRINNLGKDLRAKEATAEQNQAGRPASKKLPVEGAVVKQHPAGHPAGEQLPAETTAAEQQRSGQPAGEELHAEEAAVDQQQARQPAGKELLPETAAAEHQPGGQPAGEDLLAEEVAAKQQPAELPASEEPHTDEEQMPLSDEDDSDFVEEKSDADDIAEIVSLAPAERDEAIDFCEGTNAREKDVIDLLDEKDFHVVATFKHMVEDIMKHLLGAAEANEEAEGLHSPAFMPEHCQEIITHGGEPSTRHSTWRVHAIGVVMMHGALRWGGCMLLLLLGAMGVGVVTQDNACAADLEALTGGFEGARALGWLDGLASAAEWRALGVTCVNGRVTELDFGKRDVRAPLPESWSELVALRSFAGESNRFQGRLPPSWSTLAAMSSFSLGVQLLTGTMPPEYSTWRDLTFFWVYGHSRLSGSIPREYSTWTGLWRFVAYHNQLSGGLPPQFSVLEQLQMLDLDRNPLGGTLPAQYSRLVWLEEADVTGSQRLGGVLPPPWSVLRALTALRLGGTGVDGEPPDEWGALHELQVLNLQGANNLRGTVPQEWGDALTSLRELRLPAAVLRRGCVPDPLRGAAQRYAPAGLVIPAGCAADGGQGEEALPSEARGDAAVPLPTFQPPPSGALSVPVDAVVALPAPQRRRRLRQLGDEQWARLSRAAQLGVSLFVADVAALAAGYGGAENGVGVTAAQHSGGYLTVAAAVLLLEDNGTAVAGFRAALVAPGVFPGLKEAGYAVQSVTSGDAEPYHAPSAVAPCTARKAGGQPRLAPVPPKDQEAAFVVNGVDFNVDFAAELCGKLGAELGAGAFGRVFKAKWRGLDVAVKLFRQQGAAGAIMPAAVIGPGGQFSLLQHQQQQQQPPPAQAAADAAQFASFKVELRMMAELSKGACLTPPRVAIIYEHVPGGSLHGRIYAQPRLSYLEVLRLGRDIAEGLAFMHPRLVHRDLKPGNGLLDDDGRAKICDLGLGRTKDPLQSYLITQVGGTPFYMPLSDRIRRLTRCNARAWGLGHAHAPEVFGDSKINHKTDIYAFAVILNEAISQRPPWNHNTAFQIIYVVSVKKERPAIPASCPPPLAKLIGKCWAHDPNRRPSAHELLPLLDHLIQSAAAALA
eukprot:jgi/Tetstr1/436627/TSEL_025423.t1